MRRIVGALQAVGVNSVPAVGLFAAGWSVGTALTLYWCENLLGILLVALRIWLHRRKTGKKGHWLARIETRGSAGAVRETGPAREAGSAGTFLGSFLGTGLVFTAGHGVFLAVLLFQVLPAEGGGSAVLDPVAMGHGLVGVALFLALGFAFDLPGLAQRPFRWMQSLADRMMGRVIVVHLTIVLGMAAMEWLGGPIALFAVFVAFKTLVDLATWKQGGEAEALRSLPDEPPRWAVAMTRGLKGHGTDEDFSAHWSRTRQEEIERLESYEEPMPGPGAGRAAASKPNPDP